MSNEIYDYILSFYYRALNACSSPTSDISKRIGANLTTIVGPTQEDAKGFRQTKKICICAAKKAETSWNEDRLIAFDKNLAAHANKLNEFMSQPLSVETLQNNFPERPQILNTELEFFVEFISECEEKIGGRGVEF